MAIAPDRDDCSEDDRSRTDPTAAAKMRIDVTMACRLLAIPAMVFLEFGMSGLFDRYVSFKNCDWEVRSERVMARLQKHIDAAENPFWAYFAKKRTELRDKQGLDDLRVLHNYLPTLRELLEDNGDLETLAMLEELEVNLM